MKIQSWLYEKIVAHNDLADGPAQFDAQMAQRGYRRASPVSVVGDVEGYKMTAYYHVTT
jgi:hypothetical protein